jgi:hypothetical protein
MTPRPGPRLRNPGRSFGRHLKRPRAGLSGASVEAQIETFCGLTTSRSKLGILRCTVPAGLAWIIGDRGL